MERINVTKTFLPPIEEYEEYVRGIWERDWLTNSGPLQVELERKLSAYLNTPNLHFMANGTLGLMIALRALDITEGEIITTPFSFVATTSAIMWQSCTPVFVDIEPNTYCIDPAKIEAAITEKTKAIMPVHVFGLPADVEKIEAIAKKHNLPVIYDAAHVFGVTYKGKSMFSYGDISMGSFHATKPFHTIEGGCLVAPDTMLANKIELIRRYGFHGEQHYMLGINAKASEFHAAMGLCNLKYVDEIIAKRKLVTQQYDKLLGNAFQKPVRKPEVIYNYAYYPILFKDEAALGRATSALNAENIYPRRYFYPSLNELPYIEHPQACPISEDISRRVVCLPLYADLPQADVKRICKILLAIEKGN